MSLGCPDHPECAMVQIVQETYTEPVTIERTEEGQIEIEVHPRSEFMRELATQVTLAYACANSECPYAVTPDQIDRLKER